MASIATAFLCACSIASADCDLSGYDQTPPPAIKSNNSSARFEWGSDADRNRLGQLWIWNYVKNNHPTAGLGVNWEKASIRRHIAHPLAPGETDCMRFFVNAVNDQPDDNAPIYYGTTQQRQDAAVYVRKPPPSAGGQQPTPGGGRRGEATSIIDTSFVDAGGKLQQVHISAASRQTEKGFILEVEQTPNVVIAMSSLPKALSSEQFQTLSLGFKEALTRASFQEYTKLNPVEALKGMFSADEAVQRARQDYVFIKSAPKITVEIPAPRVEEVAADLIVLDQKLQPVFATEIMLLVPFRRSPRYY
jgi:hypothetical protein